MNEELENQQCDGLLTQRSMTSLTHVKSEEDNFKDKKTNLVVDTLTLNNQVEMFKFHLYIVV